MYSEQIVLRDAVIDSIHCKTEDGKVQSRIQVHGSLTQEVADVLGAKSLLFAHNGTPKEGFSSLALNTGCAAFRALFEADPALKQSFELVSGDSTDRYIVERLEDGILKVKLRLNYHGDPHAALAYIVAIGNAESKLKIVPLQATMDGEDRAKTNAEYADEDDADEADEESPIIAEAKVAREAVRQRLISGRKRGRQAAGAGSL